MTKLIWSEEEVHTFYNLLPRLKPLEAYFVSLSARNKYLTPEERVAYDLGRTEMFGREVVETDTFQRYLSILRRYECEDGAWLTRSGLPIPSKCLIVYGTINPCDTLYAFREFVKTVQSHQDLILTKLIEGQQASGNLADFPHIVPVLKTEFQKHISRRYWKDIDFDLPEELRDDVNLPYIGVFLKELEEKKVEYHVVKTRSGYHVLLRKDHIKYNYTETLSAMNVSLKDRFPKKVEIAINTNDMIPVPGTVQSDHQVRFVKHFVPEVTT